MESPSEPATTVFVCTHHRCGTVLMRNVFRRYAALAPAAFFKGDPGEAPADADIVHDAHSRSPVAAAGAGIHLYRDPFDLLLSHIRYHETTTSPSEPPNMLRMKDGRTYGEHLRALPTLSDKAMLEIDTVFGRTLRSMLAWDYDNPNFRNYPLDLFLDAATAERVAGEIADTFPLFAGQRDTLRGAMLHFIVNATHIRDSHGTRGAGEGRAIELFSPAVIERMYREFPAIRAVEARLAASPVPGGRDLPSAP
ncbi:hypothetical protein DLJ53_32090 [Acuticoccus sediminis]|uniref:Sulfotransferase family protein n=1 Tax=Acuticoccus sediminis TaxID=2184697 RepID=A0A8B2NK97_9HYPH|nr:hypothetical protein [Acuticoccus sediminis]RAH96552.1 hypothetical protein DLJ53_32090 [Acuticoccus sediminis]